MTEHEDPTGVVQAPAQFDPYVQAFDVADLLLDPLNSRIEVGEGATQAEILDAVADEGADQLFRLAGDIIDAGMLNPADLPMVIVEDQRPVIVEGNRRLAALRVLADPNSLSNPDLAKRAAKLEGKPEITTINCIVFDARESADRWISLRHTGENDGAGVRGWNVAAQARFAERAQGRIGIHTAFLKWVERTYPQNDALMEAVKAIRVKQLTTLKRLLFGAVRPLLGIDWHKQTLSVTAESGAMEDFLESWFSELVTGRARVGETQRLWSRFTEDDMLEYVRQRASLLNVRTPELPVAGWTSPDEPVRPIPDTASAPQQGKPPTPGPSPTPQPPGPGPIPQLPPAKKSTRTKLFVGVDFKQFGSSIDRLARQANDLSIAHHTRPAGVMLRVVLELVVREFLRRHGNKEPGTNEYLWKMVRDCVEYLDPGVANGKGPLKDVYLSFDKGRGGMAADTMQAWVHELAAPETAPSEVRAMADTIEPLLVAAAKNLGQTKES